MIANPGSVAGQMPPGDDALIRRIQDLERQMRELGPAIQTAVGATVSGLAATVTTLTTQQTYLASLISRDAAIGTFGTGTLTSDSTFHLVGSQVVVSLPIPTGKARITISSSEASISPAGNSVIAVICYAIDGISSLDPQSQYARLYSAGYSIGSSLVRVGTETLTPGTYTIRAQCAYWSAGTGAASISFAGLRLLTEVIGAG